ncbi:MAG: hypothetical protein HS128_16975 [Ideonella sp.]|nr:hypothetical protein [Ideonella sp.]MCC7456991.1 hypothetical protein [Nitrospira sp.]
MTTRATPAAAGPTLAQRVAAASTTAASDSNACAPIRPFYWEIGDRSGAQATGSVNSTTDPTVYAQDTVMAIASASKWLYGAYVAQLRGGALSDDDIRFLTFRSGYVRFDSCQSLGEGYRSVQCGRLIRKAWFAGSAN